MAGLETRSTGDPPASGNALPGWLEQELWAAWRRQQAEGRPERFTQPAMF